MAPPLEEQEYPIAPSLVPAAAGGAPAPGDEPGRSFWLTPWALAAAALLHLLPAMLWLLAHLEARPSYEVPAIQVTLVREPPPAPPPAKTEPPKIAPRESGADEKTQAKKTVKAEPALPQSGSPRDSQARPTPAQPRADAPAEKFLAIRLPQKGGNADRDLAGDPYLNRMMQMIERHRIYPAGGGFHRLNQQAGDLQRRDRAFGRDERHHPAEHVRHAAHRRGGAADDHIERAVSAAAGGLSADPHPHRHRDSDLSARLMSRACGSGNKRVARLDSLRRDS